MLRRAVVALALVALVAAPRRAAADRPSDWDLVLAGGAMAIPAYLLGVALHEGTHAIVAKAYGAEITRIRLYPGFYEGHFYFGLTTWRGDLTRGERAQALLAPKLTDLLLLGGFTALYFADGLPDNRYGAEAFVVVATGAWVDFSKDIVSWNPVNDVIKVHAMYGNTRELERLPWRFLHLAVSAAAGYVVWLGWEHVFRPDDQPTAFIIPIVGGAFR